MKQRGLTLVELMTTLSVIVLLMGAFLIMSASGRSELALMRSAQKLALDISRQQANAMSAKEVGGEVPCGYGVHFDTGVGDYILFADRATGHDPDCSSQDFQLSSGEQILVNNLEAGVIVSGFNNSDIVFNPPEPQVYFYPGATAPAEVILQSLKTTKSVKVVVTLAGQIYIQRIQ